MREEFKNSFQFNTSDFKEPIYLVDANIGFSVTKKMGEEGWASLFYFYIKNEDLKSENEFKPLYIRVSYGKIDEDNNHIIVAGSDLPKKTINLPIDLKSEGDFLYNIRLKKFYTKNKKEISANQIFDKIYNQHIKTTKLFRGMWLRMQLIFWRIIATKAMMFLSDLLALLLYLSSGTKVKNIYLRVGASSNMEIEERGKSNFDERKTVKFFGYDAPIWTITFYASIHIIIYLIFWTTNYKPEIITTIIKNNFLTIMYVLATLPIAEIVIPNILKFLVRKTSPLFLRASSKSIKI